MGAVADMLADVAASSPELAPSATYRRPPGAAAPLVVVLGRLLAEFDDAGGVTVNAYRAREIRFTSTAFAALSLGDPQVGDKLDLGTLGEWVVGHDDGPAVRRDQSGELWIVRVKQV